MNITLLDESVLEFQTSENMDSDDEVDFQLVNWYTDPLACNKTSATSTLYLKFNVPNSRADAGLGNLTYTTDSDVPLKCENLCTSTELDAKNGRKTYRCSCPVEVADMNKQLEDVLGASNLAKVSDFSAIFKVAFYRQGYFDA